MVSVFKFTSACWMRADETMEGMGKSANMGLIAEDNAIANLSNFLGVRSSVSGICCQDCAIFRAGYVKTETTKRDFAVLGGIEGR